MIKNGMQLMCLELPFLHQVHQSRDAGESESAESNDGNGSVHLEPRIYRQSCPMRLIDRREQRKKLDEKNKRGGKSSHQRKAIRRTDDEVDERDRPGKKNENFEQIRDRAATDCVSTNRKKNGLKNKSKRNGDEIEVAAMQRTGTQRQNCSNDGSEKTGSGENDEKAIHRDRRV